MLAVGKPPHHERAAPGREPAGRPLAAGGRTAFTTVGGGAGLLTVPASVPGDALEMPSLPLSIYFGVVLLSTPACGPGEPCPLARRRSAGVLAPSNYLFSLYFLTTFVPLAISETPVINLFVFLLASLESS